MTNETHNTKPRRRWFQFSLRTLLIVVTLSAVPLGWLGWKLEQGRTQRAVVAWVEEMGGSVQFGGGWVDELFGLGVSYVNLTNTPVSDLSPLAELRSLEVLWLDYTPVSDMSPLTELKSLRELYLHNTQVSGEQEQTLRQALPNCEIWHSIRNEK